MDIATKGTADIEVIKHRIYEVRGLRVMLDRNLAELYNVETRRLNEAVKRNIERFPEDFMFRLETEEWDCLRSQIATLNEEKRNLKSQFVTSNLESSDNEANLKSQIATSSLEMANIENNTQFVDKSFDHKIMKETEQDAKMAA